MNVKVKTLKTTPVIKTINSAGFQAVPKSRRKNP